MQTARLRRQVSVGLLARLSWRAVIRTGPLRSQGRVRLRRSVPPQPGDTAAGGGRFLSRGASLRGGTIHDIRYRGGSVDFSLNQTFEERSFTRDGVEGAGMPDTTLIKAVLRIQQRRCKTETCGKCWTCLDNAKWDRV